MHQISLQNGGDADARYYCTEKSSFRGKWRLPETAQNYTIWDGTDLLSTGYISQKVSRTLCRWIFRVFYLTAVHKHTLTCPEVNEQGGQKNGSNTPEHYALRKLHSKQKENLPEQISDLTGDR